MKHTRRRKAPAESKRLEELAAPLERVSFQPDDAVPLIVYHYTKLRGLIGILDERAIRASHYAFLNDATENKYAMGRACALVRGLATGSAVQSELVSRISQGLSRSSSLYVASFCQQPDLLSMWRGYGSMSQGRFAIGLHVDRLAEGAAKRSRWAVGPVSYTKEQQERWVVGRIKEVLLMLRESDLRFLPALAKRCSSHITGALPFLKHPAFEEEDEWRAVQVRPSMAAKVDQQRGSLFLEYRPRLAKSIKDKIFPIVDIWIGPTPDASVARERVALLLERFGHKGVEIKHSTIPLQE